MGFKLGVLGILSCEGFLFATFRASGTHVGSASTGPRTIGLPFL